AAAAEVAGAAALLKANDSSASNGTIVGRLARNADAAGTSDQTGNGRLNLGRAIADTSVDAIEPAGSPPVGGGGPIIGPYVVDATNRTMSYTRAGTGTGTVTFARITGDTPDTATGGCSITGNNAICTASGTFNFKNNDAYRITAAAGGGSTFQGWSGQSGDLNTTNCGGTTNPCPSSTTSITLGVNSAITATFNAPPTVTSTSPSSRGQGATNQNVTITGTRFVSGAVASFSGIGITVNSTTFVSATSLNANITVSSTTATGLRDVTFTKPKGSAGTGT